MITNIFFGSFKRNGDYLGLGLFGPMVGEKKVIGLIAGPKEDDDGVND